MEATLAGAGAGDGPSFAALKTDPGRVALESLLGVADRLASIRRLDLPREALVGVATPVIERPRRRGRRRAAGRCAAMPSPVGWDC